MMIHFLPHFVILITTNLFTVQCIVCEKNSRSNDMVFKTVGEEKRNLFLKYFSFNKNIENDRFRCYPYCYNSFNLFSRSDAAEEKLAQTSSYLQDCLSKQLFIEKHKVTGQHVDIYTFQMILRFVIKAFEEESSLLLPEVYDRYKLLLHKNDLNIVIDSDKDMSKLLHFTQLIFNMLKSVLGRALSCYVPKKKKLCCLIYRNDADVLGSCHSLFWANHCSSNQIALMEKENLKLTNTISSLITDDLKNRKHESLEHAAQILRNVIKLYVSDRIKTDRLPDIDNFNCRDEIFKIHPLLWNLLFRFVDKITIIMIMLP